MGRRFHPQPTVLTLPLCLWCSHVHGPKWRDKERGIKACPVAEVDRDAMGCATACSAFKPRFMFHCPHWGLVTVQMCNARVRYNLGGACRGCDAGAHAVAYLKDHPVKRCTGGDDE